MGSKTIDPQSIRNVTIIGHPDDTAHVVHRLFRRFAGARAGTSATVHWMTDHIDHMIRITELSSNAPTAALERSVRVADAVIAVMNAAVQSAPRLETVLRVVDDHQVARLCLVTGLDHPAADFERCVRMIADTHGAVPVTLQIPHGLGAEFEGVVDLVPMRTFEPMASEFYGSHWKVAEAWYRNLVDTVLDQEPAGSDGNPGLREVSPQQLHDRVRSLTRSGDAAPVLCDAARTGHIALLLDAVVRYLPSPIQVCQPEHVLDY